MSAHLSAEAINEAIKATEWSVEITNTCGIEVLSVHDVDGDYIATFPRDTAPHTLIVIHRLCEKNYEQGKAVGAETLKRDFRKLMDIAWNPPNDGATLRHG